MIRLANPQNLQKKLIQNIFSCIIFKIGRLGLIEHHRL